MEYIYLNEKQKHIPAENFTVLELFQPCGKFSSPYVAAPVQLVTINLLSTL